MGGRAGPTHQHQLCRTGGSGRRPTVCVVQLTPLRSPHAPEPSEKGGSTQPDLSHPFPMSPGSMRCCLVAGLAAAVVVVAVRAAAPPNATDCGGPKDADIAFAAFDFDPTQPVRGEPLVVCANGSVAGRVQHGITGGDGTVSVTLNGLPLFSGPFKTCGQTSISLPLGLGSVAIQSMSCPAPGGSDVAIVANLTIPSIAPPGQYEAKLTASDQNGGMAYCLAASMSL